MLLGVSGKYRLDQRLGGGGMAEVFLGSTVGAEGFSRRVAIKRVLPGFSDNDAFAQMFVDEARISSQLVHPNIVSVLDFDRDAENRLFLVMELVEGKDLDALLQTGIVPVPVVIYVIAEVLRGLGYAHDLPVGTHVRGVVHRDISPHNVLLSWEGAVKVSDFGIAKARAASEATASIFIKGKPAYMSPEQANGQPLDGRSDLFAVGIMLWEMLVGRRLFVGEDTRSTLAAVLFGQIPRPRSLRGELPKDLERVTMKLLERDLPARYATAEEAIADLLDCADAPKAGRELLTATLGERFVGQAPVRHSRARSIPPGGRASSPPVMTLPDGSPGAGGAGGARRTPAAAVPVDPRAATMPSLGSVRNAPTGTLDVAPRQRRRRKLLLAGGALAAAAAATVAIVVALGSGGGGGGASQSSGGAGGSSSGGAAGSQLAAAGGEDASRTGPTAEAAIPPSPLPPSPPPLTSPVDAGAPPDAPTPPVDAGSAPTPDAAPRRPEKTGRLQVTGSNPSVAVYYRGRRLGDTPGNFTLPVGTYEITLKQQDNSIPYKDRTISVTIRENQTTTVTR